MNNPFEALETRLHNIEALLLDIKHSTPTPIETNIDQWFDLVDLCNYHPDKPKPATVYGWVFAGTIPVHKGGKKLRFLKSEIDEWLKQGRKMTIAETSLKVEEYLKSK
ncbi:helix-turn-helix domain-containing protein [Flavobacterium pectinovorum]|uniref:helix-turn-helix domain-containing protein n=1 Tax=Flavobacterium pectinovorum TaxID=29533 RepID=UPI00265E2A20|nr:helix-turn-helix domain-containing protein [Flavobacterium pectinovorum]WKL47628.1 helix-turn-helix domain-containing protein [Flavobacterium pectinovorum]